MKILKRYFFVSMSVLLLTMIIVSCSSDSNEVPIKGPAPTIASIEPLSGAEGTPVNILGANFSSDATLVSVSFNGVEATEISFSSIAQISTKVPVGATSGNVSVTIDGQTVQGGIFTVERSFTVTPQVGEAGDEVILTGKGFSTILAENIIRFNGVAAVVNSATETRITTTVPVDATSGPITLLVNEQAYIQDGPDFVVSTIPENETPENFKIAFIGDTQIGGNADAVLDLIKNEGTGAVVHSGDFDYSENPQAFEDNINAVLGQNFPYFVSVGNHDDAVWNGAKGYRTFFEARMNRLGISWNGDYGLLSSFSYKGIFFVDTAPDEFDITPSTAGNYIKQELDKDKSVWRISFWHKNQRLMQVGGKRDEAGWPPYEESRKGGAIIATGHEHSYSRTYEMSNFQTQVVSSTNNIVNLIKDDASTNAIDEGRSFAFVSGLGGNSIRSARDGLETNPWWADAYYSGNGGQHGALFGEFNYEGDGSLARFYFKDIDGVERDVFFVRSKN